MAEADALALLKLLHQASFEIAPYRDLTRFTDFAVQIRYDDQPDLQDLDRLLWNAKAEALVLAIESLLRSPGTP